MNAMDGSILMWIQEYLTSSILINLFYCITLLGNGGILWLGYAGYFLIKKEPKKALIIVITLLLSSFLTDVILKNVFMRPRPFVSNSAIVPRIIQPASTSFPSGHSSTSFACSFMIAYLDEKKGKLAQVMAGLIALSRLILCVHYPSDVLCGILLGIGIAKGLYRIVRKGL